jgi:hypothetical protein
MGEEFALEAVAKSVADKTKWQLYLWKINRLSARRANRCRTSSEFRSRLGLRRHESHFSCSRTICRASIRHAFCRSLASPNSAGSVESNEAYIAPETNHLVSKLHFIANTIGCISFHVSHGGAVCYFGSISSQWDGVCSRGCLFRYASRKEDHRSQCREFAWSSTL